MAAPVLVEIPAPASQECSQCAGRLREGLSGHRGVLGVRPRTDRDAIEVSYDPDLCSLECLDDAARVLRIDLANAFAHELLRIEGMDCADCAQTIERAVARLEGVTHATVSFPGQSLRIEYRPQSVGLERIAGLVRRLGYRIKDTTEKPRPRRWPSREQITWLASGLLGVALIVDLFTGLTPVPWYAASILLGGVPLARSGLTALAATRRPDINLLMSIAVIGATAIGAWLEAALVVVLFAVGQLLERRAVERAHRELAELVALSPDVARVRRRRGDGPLAVVAEVEVPVAELSVGDLVVVRPGERIPVDGVLREGASSVDQAPITGESTPIDKEVDDDVYAGTLNGQGLLLIEAMSAPGDTTLDRIGRLVAEAQARKSPAERWVDAFARWYTPAVIALAVLVATLLPIVGASWSGSFYQALALLILACPCALVISTPVAIVSALGRASAAGVLVKGGAHLEQAAAIRAVAFDKTGTLTRGRPDVITVEPLAGSGDRLLSLAASLEQGSEHPLARAIVRAAAERGLSLRPVEQFEALTGLGARGQVDGAAVTVGDSRLVDDVQARGLEERLTSLRNLGQTAVVVQHDGTVAGVIGLTDTPRAEAADAVASLRSLGIAHIAMLTGDNGTTAAAIARQVGIDDVRASLLPHDKTEAIDALGPELLMVGDGINDAPALAQASLGIAMGTAGSDTALEVADVAITGDDLRKVPGLIGLARWTRAVVRENIAFSLATKVAAAALLAAGALPLWGAVVADVGASLVVVANGLRLLRGRPAAALRGAPLLPAASRATSNSNACVAEPTDIAI